jgi:hypothetical protein
MVNQAERRRSQRVSARLPLKVFLDPDRPRSASDGLETINISLSGVYFRSRHYIAPMTKLAMGLELEIEGADGVAVDHALVQCHGLVVRIQPEEELPEGGDYEVAVFFTWIEPQGQAILQEHINLLLNREKDE